MNKKTSSDKTNSSFLILFTYQILQIYRNRLLALIDTKQIPILFLMLYFLC